MFIHVRSAIPVESYVMFIHTRSAKPVDSYVMFIRFGSSLHVCNDVHLIQIILLKDD